MPLGRFMVFVAALVLLPAAWARAPRATPVEPAKNRYAAGGVSHRGETSLHQRRSAEALRVEELTQPIFATQNPR